MKHFDLAKGLDIPISGEPAPTIGQAHSITRVGLTGDDYIGMKPTMEVQVGDRVKKGQLLFTDKKNEGVRYTSPAGGRVIEINRGPKRKFESLVIEVEEEESISFLDQPGQAAESCSSGQIREVLIQSGLWTALRTRPYGKVPEVDAVPAALFITAIDSEPLAPPPEIIIGAHPEHYRQGLLLLRRLLECPIHYCSGQRQLLDHEQVDGLDFWSFSGPHPAGLPSTHIHFIEPVSEQKSVWHIGYQDVAALGALFATGELGTERIVSLAGPAVKSPRLIRTRLGADISQVCAGEVNEGPVRLISGSVLSGRTAADAHRYLGRYHNQISALPDSSGRALFNWAMPGGAMFSVKPVFTSALAKKLQLPMITALWGGKRAIYPLGTYEDVMPLDIIPVYLLKALAVKDTEKSKDLGCLELIEEDLALCGFSCPGKNEFGSMLRDMLTTIELGG